jgi:hypothetical protein
MRLLSLTVFLLAAVGLSGCLSTHREEYSTTSTLGVGPQGVQATSDGTYSVRDWASPWLAQPDRARP